MLAMTVPDDQGGDVRVRSVMGTRGTTGTGAGTAAVAVAAAAVCALVLTGCDSGDSKGAKAGPSSPSATATVTATPAASTSAAPSTTASSTAVPSPPETPDTVVKLSEKWQSQLATVDKGSASCDDAGSDACFQQMSVVLKVMSPILNDAQADVGKINYIVTAGEVSTISKAVTDYSQRMCMRNAHANTPGSNCARDARAVADGPRKLEAAMKTDEAAPSR